MSGDFGVGMWFNKLANMSYERFVLKLVSMIRYIIGKRILSAVFFGLGSKEFDWLELACMT